jgi:hypothetical protein
MPTVYMWCAQTTKPTTPIGDHGVGHAEIAEDRLCGEGRDDVADDAEGRQDHDVDFGVAEEPEQVLEQHRIAAAGRVEEGVPKLRSVSSMVIAPARTGSDSSSRKAVTSIPQTNSGILCSVMPGARMLKMVVMKLMAPRIDEAPARCSAKIAMSTEGPGWYRRWWRAADRASSPPAPPPTPGDEPAAAGKAGTISQKLMLFMRGNAMSGAPIISGTNQLPKPPISAGHDDEEHHDQAVRGEPSTNSEITVMIGSSRSL